MKYAAVNVSLAIGAVAAIYTALDQPKKDGIGRAVTGIIEYEQMAEEKTEQFIIETKRKLNLTAKELDCLARNIFYEAGVEPYKGKLAVAQVTYNRIGMRKNWTDICKVVYARAQFSWTLDSNKKYKKPHGPLWAESKKAAMDFVSGKSLPELENSDHYYATYIKKPKWAKKMTLVTKIGQHAFYTQGS